MNTKESLIGESLKVFLEHGYDNFSMRDVSKAVGIKQPTMYYHFKDKLDLFKECLRAFFEKWYVWLAQSTDEETDLEVLIHTTCMSFAMDQDIVETLYGVKTVTGQYRLIFDALTYCPECLKYMANFNADYYRVLDGLIQKAKMEGQIRKDVTTSSLYILLGSMIEGSNIMRLTDPDLDFSQQTENIFNIIWNGLQTNEEQETLSS
jgi:AcrR family transcriptional regulator